MQTIEFNGHEMIYVCSLGVHKMKCHRCEDETSMGGIVVNDGIDPHFCFTYCLSRFLESCDGPELDFQTNVIRRSNCSIGDLKDEHAINELQKISNKLTPDGVEVDVNVNI